MATHMRLRLVVRRNGLPDTNVVWPVPIENNPTIAKLLEQVSEILPLESGEWGLEDYAVELQGSDGSSFECLHFQPIRSVLKEDDQVLIRPLFTDDLRRRRVSGRHQISTDGKHLIDGIAFGRPLLKAPRGRPGLEIPPRKRRRITLNDESSEADETEVDEDAEYEDDDGDSPVLLLTNGDEEDCASKSVRIAAEFDDIDPDVGHQADQDDFRNDNIDDHSESEGVYQDMDQDSESAEGDDDMQYDFEDDEDLMQELRDLREDRKRYEALQDVEQNVPERRASRSQAGNQQSSGVDAEIEGETQTNISPGARSLSLETLDKIGALRTAFPLAPAQVCQEILVAEEGDMKNCYLTLLQGFQAKLSESELLKLWRHKQGTKTHNSAANVSSSTQKDLSTGIAPVAVPDTNDVDEEEESDNDEADIPSYIRRFDHQGLPPGSISSGNALKAMAAISASFSSGKKPSDGGRDPSPVLVGTHKRLDIPNKTDELDDDETSSSGTSSSSEEEGETSQVDESDDDSSSEGEDSMPGPSGNGDEHVTNSDSPSIESDDDSENDSDSDSDSPPEVKSSKSATSLSTSDFQNKGKSRGERVISNGVSSKMSSSSSESSDADDETSSSNESSGEETSEAESSSESETEETSVRINRLRQPAVLHTPLQGVAAAELPQSQPPSVYTQPPVPPGQGKLSTKMRNSRRRTKKNASKLLEQTKTPNAACTSVSAEKESDKTLFEAKRQALLNAIADGGVEVGPGSHLPIDTSHISHNGKRKRDEVATPKADEQISKEAAAAAGEEVESPTTSQKRRRLDVGAGRRMLFGALGLRNPKTKEDEDKLRTKLMENFRPLQNARLADEESSAQTLDSKKAGAEIDAQEPIEDDLNSWRAKITYRAVECCHDGVELSEPPFPFVQRWDPQQQVNWGQKKNKRGGRGKRAERNQSHFYQDESRNGTQRPYDKSQSVDVRGDYKETHSQDIQLNYDDVEPSEPEKDVANETSQFTDLDDLPSLPQDLSILPDLHPGEVQEGMVITWKQLTLSESTNWQPQVSDLTGVVCNIYDDGTDIKVMLAKRDRNLDRNEKKFDNSTGQRIYGKFEAPAFEDEADEDVEESEGYRTVSFAQMMEPKVVQPAIPMSEQNEEGGIVSIEQHLTSPNATTTANQNDTMLGEVENSTHTMDEPLSALRVVPEDPTTSDMHPDTTALVDTAKGTKEPVIGTANNSTGAQPTRGRESHTISLSDLSQVSSPTLQLQKESMNDLITASPDKEVSPELLAGTATSRVEGSTTEFNHSGHAQGYEDTSIPSLDIDALTSTPKIMDQKSTAALSSASSVGSGRQPEICMDIDMAEPDSLRTTEGSIDNICSHNNIEESDLLDEQSVSAGGQGERIPTSITPTQPSNILNSQKAPDGTKAKDTDTPNSKNEGYAETSSPAAPDTPFSLTSPNTVWCTAATSLNTRSPSKSRLPSGSKAEKSQDPSQGDAEYEAAMRKLDGFDGDDNIISQDVSRISDSFRPGTEESNLDTQSLSLLNGSPESSHTFSLRPRARTETKISPTPSLRRGRPRKSHVTSSPLVKKTELSGPRTRKSTQSSQPKSSIPPGSQVFEINSDSDEASFVESYADELVDDSYSPAGPPKGIGLVKKESRKARSSKGPLETQKGRTVAGSVAGTSQASSNVQTNGMQQNAATATRRMGKGRKASAKF